MAFWRKEKKKKGEKKIEKNGNEKQCQNEVVWKGSAVKTGTTKDDEQNRRSETILCYVFERKLLSGRFVYLAMVQLWGVHEEQRSCARFS